jgi:hypothetical protein
MTKLVNIQELYNLIPETRALEGVNFTNLRQLLGNVIEKVEQTGCWEFVQYIQGNPSLFVVRQKPVRSDDRLTNSLTSQYETRPYAQSELESTPSTPKKTKAPAKNTQPAREEEKSHLDYENIEPENSKLFPKTTLPWS